MTFESHAKTELARKATEITLARLSNFTELMSETVEESDKKLRQLTRALWKEFTVHGKLGIDKQTKEKTILNFTDLDGKCALGLLQTAGMDTTDVKYVAPGESHEGRINLDTGYKHGLVVEAEGRTAYLDHHGKASGCGDSATKVTYEALVSLGILKKVDYLDLLVEFVTHVDNSTYPNGEEHFKDSWHTILGLQRFIQFKHLLNFFTEGRDPTDHLSDEEIKKYGLINGSKEQKGVVESSLKRLKEMEKQGLIVDTKRYGRVAIDIGKTVGAGWDAAKACGCGGYVIWNPKTKSFFVTTKEPLAAEFIQGQKIRETMWIKPQHDTAPLLERLERVVDRLTDGEYEPTGELKKYFEADAKRPKSPSEINAEMEARGFTCVAQHIPLAGPNRGRKKLQLAEKYLQKNRTPGYDVSADIVDIPGLPPERAMVLVFIKKVKQQKEKMAATR